MLLIASPARSAATRQSAVHPCRAGVLRSTPALKARVGTPRTGGDRRAPVGDGRLRREAVLGQSPAQSCVAKRARLCEERSDAAICSLSLIVPVSCEARRAREVTDGLRLVLDACGERLCSGRARHNRVLKNVTPVFATACVQSRSAATRQSAVHLVLSWSPDHERLLTTWSPSRQ